jgi:DNA-binding CsgD family transcriptional regulator
VTADTQSVSQPVQTGLCKYADSSDKGKGMNPDRIERLTDKQRQCLRLVYAHKETKEIARILGLSPDGVTQRIKAAMRTLEVDKRRDAALILAEAEGLTAYPREVYPSRDIASAPEAPMLAPSTESGRHESGFVGRAMMEEQAVFTAAPPAWPRGVQVPLPFWGSRPSDLSWFRRLGWIIGIMFMVALVFGMFLAGLEALSRMTHSS